jgi:hypothetical protein
MRVEPLSIQTRDRPQWAGAYRMQDIEIFVQAEGRPTISLIQVKQDATTEELAAAAIVQGATLWPMGMHTSCPLKRRMSRLHPV